MAQMDAAIERWLDWIAMEPDRLPHHQAAYDCALRRKAVGGGPVGVTWRMRARRLTPMQRLIDTERAWLMDPLDLTRMRDVIVALAQVNDDDASKDMMPIIDWIRVFAMTWGG